MASPRRKRSARDGSRGGRASASHDGRARPSAREADVEVEALQQAVGNRAVDELLRAGHEAAPPEGGGPASVDAVLDAPGQPLDAGVRALLEARFGADLLSVVVHTGEDAALSAEAVDAKAYAVGEHLVFGPGRYRPDGREGRALIAHEVAHVLQQRRGRGRRASPTPPHGAEAEARQAARSADGAVPLRVTSAVAPQVQRAPDDDEEKKKRKKKAKRKKSTRARKPGKAKGSGAKPTAKPRAPKIPAEYRRGVEILKERAEYAEKGRAARGGSEEVLTERGMSVRTPRSEATRHKSTLYVPHGHHGFPKFLGGARLQMLIKLTNDLHYLYHEELYYLLEKELKSRGALRAEAGRDARRLYGKIFRKLDPKAQKAILGKVMEHAKDFDTRYSKLYPDKRTRVAAALKRGISEARKAEKAAAKAKAEKASAKKGTAKAKPEATKKPKAKAKSRAPRAKAKAPRAKARAKATPKPVAKTPKVSGPAAKARALPVKAPATKAPAAKAPNVKAPTATPAPGRLKLTIRGGLKAGGAALVGIAIGLLGSWIESKLEQKRINKDLAALGPEIGARMRALAPSMGAYLDEAPGAKLYLNVTIDLEYHQDIDPDPGGGGVFITYQGLSLAAVNFSPNDIQSEPKLEGWKLVGLTKIVKRRFTYSVPLEVSR